MEILTLRAPGSDAWDANIAFRLAVDHDRNRSTRLEPGELRRVPCDVWQAMDIALVEGSPYPGLQRTYGFEGDGPWLAGALGIDERHRARAARQLDRCGLTPPLGPSQAEELYLLEVLQSLPDAGSEAWQGVVAAAMVSTYDRDGSRLLEADELQSVDCTILISLQLGLKRVDGSIADYLERPTDLGIASAGALADRADTCILP